MVAEGDQDRRGAAEVRDSVLANERPGTAGVEGGQTHLGASYRHHRPGEAPAVAMEHGEGPEIDRVCCEPGADDLAQGVLVGATMVDHYPFGPTRGAAGVVDGDGGVLPFLGVE